jgi:hypothetical protein
MCNRRTKGTQCTDGRKRAASEQARGSVATAIVATVGAAGNQRNASSDNGSSRVAVTRRRLLSVWAKETATQMTSPASEALPSYQTGRGRQCGTRPREASQMARGGSQENSFTAALAQCQQSAFRFSLMIGTYRRLDRQRRCYARPNAFLANPAAFRDPPVGPSRLRDPLRHPERAASGRHHCMDRLRQPDRESDILRDHRW